MREASIGRYSLLFAAVADFLIAALHVAIIAVGPAAYLYFGAVGLATRAGEDPTGPALMTLGVTAIFVAWGCYALSAARFVRHLPLVRAVLAVVSLLLILRGLVVIPDLARLFAGAGYPVRQTVISAVALVVGILHLPGTVRAHR